MSSSPLRNPTAATTLTSPRAPRRPSRTREGAATSVVPTRPPVCFDASTGTIRGGRYDGVTPPRAAWRMSSDGKSVTLDLGGDNVATLPVCAKAPPPPSPECCVHILTGDIASISASAPARGRLDCPGDRARHEAEVTVTGVRPDGRGGLQAAVVLPATAVPAGRTRLVTLSVCSVGPQDKLALPCCIVEIPGKGRFIKCEDPKNPLHGQPAAVAIARGYTLELCPPPPALPPCCVELGSFVQNGTTYTGKLVCDDPTRPLHGRLVHAQAAPDGIHATVVVQKPGTSEMLTVVLLLCEGGDVVKDEIPCCIRDNRLYCPDHPEYHGMTVEQFQQLHTDQRLAACPEEPPPLHTLPPDCCVQLDEAGGNPILVCSNPNNPWHGYQIAEGHYNCVPEQGYCEVLLTGPDGSQVRGRMPLCPQPPPERIPPDCCYDVATGTLICRDEHSEWNGLKVSLEQMVGGTANSPMFAVVSHAKLGSAPMRFPVCEQGGQPDCCFQPGPPGSGANGQLVCPSNAALNGMAAILTDVNLVNGQVIATVSWPGGGARMPFCCAPAERVPRTPPSYFCCVNIDTGTYVCPADSDLNGKPASIKQLEQVDGMPFVRLSDDTLVPACGSQCPAPEPCPLCPDVPGGGGLIPTAPDPCEPDADVPMTTPGTPQGTIPGAPPPCASPGAVPMWAPGTPQGTIPAGSTCP